MSKKSRISQGDIFWVSLTKGLSRKTVSDRSNEFLGQLINLVTCMNGMYSTSKCTRVKECATILSNNDNALFILQVLPVYHLHTGAGSEQEKRAQRVHKMCA